MSNLIKKPDLDAGKSAIILEFLSLLASISVLAAITQHVMHLNQLSQHLIAAHLSRTGPGSFTVGPDFQLIPLVPLAVLLAIAAIFVRKRLSTAMLVSIVILLCACAVWLFGFHLAKI